MTTIGSTPLTPRYLDRATQVERSVQASDGRFTVEEVTARIEESDRLKLQAAQSKEAFLAGKGTYLGSSRGDHAVWDPQGYAESLDQARQARSEHYTHFSGPVVIAALNVDSAISAQGELTGGDLKNLSYYADYLRNEVAAATQAKGSATFVGAWGKNRVTNDVNEYISWLLQAAQHASQGVTDERQTA